MKGFDSLQLLTSVSIIFSEYSHALPEWNFYLSCFLPQATPVNVKTNAFHSNAKSFFQLCSKFCVTLTWFSWSPFLSGRALKSCKTVTVMRSAGLWLHLLRNTVAKVERYSLKLSSSWLHSPQTDFCYRNLFNCTSFATKYLTNCISFKSISCILVFWL